MRINDYLKKLHWSQTDLARQAGVSTGTVKRAMTGATISARSAQAITAALDTGMSRQASVRPGDITGLHVARTTRKRAPRGLKAEGADGWVSRSRSRSRSKGSPPEEQ